MGDENNSNLKIISDHFIKPKHNVDQSKQSYYLSTQDLFQLSGSYMYRGLLYAKPSTLRVESLVDELKHSMSIALVDFYPLAGRLETIKYEDEHASLIYVDCTKGPGARLIHASATEEYKLYASDIVSSQYNYIFRLFFDPGQIEVVNHDGHNRALVSVQVTELVDGVFIGFAMNHSIGDGNSFWYLINSLSKIFMNKETYSNNIEKPIFKAVYPDGYGPIFKLPYLDPNEFIIRPNIDPDLTLQVFHFTGESIARLKALANVDNTTRISSFQALSALLWISVARARAQDIRPESDIDCWLIGDTRSKLDPPLSSNRFGNFVKLIKGTSKGDELKQNGLGWAAMVLNKAVTGLDDNVIRGFVKTLAESPQVAIPVQKRADYGTIPPLILTGSMRFDTYGPEFGLGKAIAIRPGLSTWIDGKVIVDPGWEGGGSVDLQVCLLSRIMTGLESDQEFMSYVNTPLK